MLSGNRAKGIFWASLASATYGLNPLFAMPLFHRGMSVDSMLFYRYLLGIVVLGAVIWFSHGQMRVKRRMLPPLIGCGVMMSTSSLSLYTAFTLMDVGIASTILFVYPVMVTAAMALFFKEKLRPATLLCVALALVGVGILNIRSGGANVNLPGVMWSVLSALSWAVYLLIVRNSCISALDSRLIAWYCLIFGLPLFFIRLKLGVDLQAVPGLFGGMLLLLMALLPTIVSMTATNLAVALVGPTVTAIFGALEPLTAVLIGIAIFGEQLTIQLVAGMALVIVSVVIVMTSKNHTQCAG